MSSRDAASIHAPARGATNGDHRRLLPPGLQSTLPHGERRRTRQDVSSRDAASIHAPARGATNGDHRRLLPPGLQSTLPHGERLGQAMATGAPSRSFNPRSRTGSDRPIVPPQRRRCRFNPRSRTGSDTRLSPPKPDAKGASIHAPARGATSSHQGTILALRRLQSTLPHGERPERTTQSSRSASLQSTLPHGERRASGTASSDCNLLQSTLPHGERLYASYSFITATY